MNYPWASEMNYPWAVVPGKVDRQFLFFLLWLRLLLLSVPMRPHHWTRLKLSPLKLSVACTRRRT